MLLAGCNARKGQRWKGSIFLFWSWYHSSACQNITCSCHNSFPVSAMHLFHPTSTSTFSLFYSNFYCVGVKPNLFIHFGICKSVGMNGFLRICVWVDFWGQIVSLIIEHFVNSLELLRTFRSTPLWLKHMRSDYIS